MNLVIFRNKVIKVHWCYWQYESGQPTIGQWAGD